MRPLEILVKLVNTVHSVNFFNSKLDRFKETYSIEKNAYELKLQASSLYFTKTLQNQLPKFEGLWLFGFTKKCKIGKCVFAKLVFALIFLQRKSSVPRSCCVATKDTYDRWPLIV